MMNAIRPMRAEHVTDQRVLPDPQPQSRPCSATISSGTTPTDQRRAPEPVDAVVAADVRDVQHPADDDQRDDADRAR